MAETAKAITSLTLGDGGFEIPVSLKKIRSASDVTLDTAGPNGLPISTAKFEIGGDADPIEPDDVRRGIFRSKPKKSDKTTWDDFVEIKPDDLAVIEDATKIDTFVIDHFIPLKDLPTERIQDAYFLAPPDGMSAKPLVLLARALRRTKRAGVFKMVKSSRQYLAVVYEQNGGLIVNTMAWSGDFSAVHEAAEALAKQVVKVKPEEIELASQIITTLSADASVLDTFEDDLIPLKADLVERAISGKAMPRRKAQTAKVATPDDDLEARLRETLSTSSASKAEEPVAV